MFDCETPTGIDKFLSFLISKLCYPTVPQLKAVKQISYIDMYKYMIWFASYAKWTKQNAALHKWYGPL